MNPSNVTDITVPLDEFNPPRVFLAGGLANCEQWHRKVVDLLSSDKGMTLIDPSRNISPPTTGSEDFISDHKEERVRWTHLSLLKVEVVSFWFAGGKSVQPEEMFLLGLQIGRILQGDLDRDQLVVGVADGFRRREDLLRHLGAVDVLWSYPIATSLEKHSINIARSVERWRAKNDTLERAEPCSIPSVPTGTGGSTEGEKVRSQGHEGSPMSDETGTGGGQ